MNENQKLALQLNRRALQAKYPTRPKAQVKGEGIFPLSAIRTAVQKGYLKMKGY